ncbi:hypothetical protein GSI_13205 [Ganoderma sinense ZZ0214-1]|uniref:Uncharacterized protein n=1 Tax=Ganoderma sinense ZZ0214-1 TaxID=1077348 RepID=A0A2G8RUW9_9APHY|nr:hypothetical protein GSI_13205 [Ganoderma sinense ZZ0214-1]
MLGPETENGLQTSSTPPPPRRSVWDPDSGLSEKVRKACEIARCNGYHYIWIDSCCINKESSSELSEAINSMFNWYRGAQVCYAFLVDVPSDDEVRVEYSKFRKSRWFTRGWTLQELVAPLVVVFLSKDWQDLGTQEVLADVIQKVTSIDIEILTHKRALSDESVANRMGWAAHRETTQIEDEAYSLLGIFGITMPTLYGEGRYAFRRLQEEILRRIPDQSLFAWGSEDIPTFPTGYCDMWCSVTDTMTLLASSPSDFTMKDNRIIKMTEDSIGSLQLPVEEYTHTPYGIRTQLYLFPLQHLNPKFKIDVLKGDPPKAWYLAILRAQKLATNPHGLLTQLCYLRKSGKANVEFVHWERLRDKNYTTAGGLYELSLDIIARVGEPKTHLKTVYLPHPKPSDSMSTRQLKGLKDYRFGVNQLNLTIPMWVQDALRVGGCTVSNIQGPSEHDRNTFSFTLFHATFNIHTSILFWHAANPDWLDQRDVVMIKACAWILSPDDGALCAAAIQSSPPSDSATWIQNGQYTTLPKRRLILRTGFWDNLVMVSLSLGLDLTSQFGYSLRIEVAPHIYKKVGPSTCNHSKDTRPDGIELKLPYNTLDFTLPGSVSRDLEMKGYSAHLSFEPSPGDTHSHSLTLSTDTDAGKFAIVVKYLQVCTLDDAVLTRSDLKLDFDSESEWYRRHEYFVITARITLESSGDGFETVQDGPHVVVWYDDRRAWKSSLEEKDIVLTTPTGELLTLRLGFDLAWCYQYYLNVNIKPGTLGPLRLADLRLSSTPTQNGHHGESRHYMKNWAHRSIGFTLPTHVNRALQAQGFQVRFERSEGGGTYGDSDPIHHLLTLSHTMAGFDIVIKYLHDLTTHYPELESDPDDPEVKNRYPLLQANPQMYSDSRIPIPTAEESVKQCRQELTFKASVQTFTCRSVQIGDAPSRMAAHYDVATAEVDWDKDQLALGPFWKRHIRRKDITLTLSTGRQLVLRLGFYLVWYSEYCPLVEINPQTPLPRPRFLYPREIRMPDYERGEDGMEYIRQVLAQSTKPGVGQSEEDPDDDPESLPVDPNTLEGSPVWSEEPEEAGNAVGGTRPTVGAVVEARGDAMESLTFSATQSHGDYDTSDAESDGK